MSLYKRGGKWWYNFFYAGRHVQESAKTTSKTVAKEAEQRRRRELEEGFSGIQRNKDRVRTIAGVAAVYLKEYKLKNRAATFAEYGVRHLCEHLGSKMMAEINDRVVGDYQINRRVVGSSPT